jgi:succinate dehydrogenase/fumarate reductase flavoprotein subunit
MTPANLSDLRENDVFDVVVVGSGVAGMSAALFAAIAGLKPLLVERTDRLGGTSAYSAGSAWIPNTHHAAAVGADDSVEKAALYLRHSVGNESPESLRMAFLRHGPQAVRELEEHSHVNFRARNLHPDYNSTLPGATLKGRVLEAAPFDGRILKGLLGLVRDPIPEFTILGGMMVNQEDVLNLLAATHSLKALRHATGILSRHAMDRVAHGRGTRLMMGNALIARLLLSLDQRQVPILLNAAVQRIHAGADGVEAISITQGDLVRRFSVRGGLIAATGGFNRHPVRRQEMLRKPVPQYCPGAPGHTGQLHDLLLELGAYYGEDGRDSAFWTPVSVRKRSDGTTAVFPHFIFDRGRPGTITVNQAGQRFMNEAVSYHPFAQGLYAANEKSPCIPAFLIADEIALRKYGLGMVRPGRFGRGPFLKDGYLTKAGTIEELADKLGMPRDNLRDTLQRFNHFARTGTDEEFGRGETDYQRITAGDPNHGPNPCLGPIETPPFYAIRLYPGDMGAATGLVTDEQARVQRKSGGVIEGLYACGNDMHSVMGGNYPGPGITIGPAIVFAYIAVRDVVERLHEAPINRAATV